MSLQKLSEIEEKLQKDYIDIKKRYIKLKRCKYALLILKTVLLSLSIGLSFINPLTITISSLVPIIDSILLITEKDKKVCDLKLQKDIINQIIKEIEIKKYTFKDNDEIEKYIIQVYGKIQTFSRYIIYIMKFINFDNIVNKNNDNYINKSVFTPQHVSNTIIIGQTGCSKTNLLFNILTLNPVFQKIYIFTKEPEAKYNFLIKKFPQDIKIFYQNDEYDLDKLIKGDFQTCCIFDDQLTDNKKISDWFIRSRKKNCSNFFLAHSYFKMSKTLRLNVNYIILFKIPKNQLTHIYNDQPINIDRELFYKIISELNKYEKIIIDLKTPIDKFQIRKNLQ